MNAPRTVLVATDLSAPGRHAVLRGALLAREQGARLELMHALEAQALGRLRALLGGETETIMPRLMQDAQRALQELADEVSAAQGLETQVRVEVGPVLKAISARASAVDAELLVLGARGSGFLRHLLLGTTTERLLRMQQRPTLVVKDRPHETYRRVLVPVDFSAASVSIARLARAIAPSAELTLFNAYEVPFEGKLRFAGVEEATVQQYRVLTGREAKATLRDLVVQAGIEGNVRQVVAHGEPTTRILEQEEQLGADLIVIGKHGTSITEELLLGSVTKHVLAEARCDVLVVHG